MKLTPYVSALLLCATLFTSCKKDKDPEEIKKEEDITLNKPHLNQSLKYETLVDIDGNKYATIQIGTQTWMAENLKTSKYNDGTTIPNVTNSNTWANLTSGAYAIYENNSVHDAIYGKLYNWYAVNTRKLCPKGWHVPTESEWLQLTTHLGSSAGSKLKSTGNRTDGTGLWTRSSSGDAEGSNESGFTGIPGGFRNYSGAFTTMSSIGFWWSVTSVDTYYVWSRGLVHFSDSVTRDEVSKEVGLSCRCIKD